MQVADLMLLDAEYLYYDKRSLAAALLYVELGISFGIFKREEVCTKIEGLVRFTYEQAQESNPIEFVSVFSHFLNQCLDGIILNDILAEIEFICDFYKMDLSRDMPQAIQKQDITVKEDFYSFASHIKGGLEFMIYLQRMRIANEEDH